MDFILLHMPKFNPKLAKSENEVETSNVSEKILKQYFIIEIKGELMINIMFANVPFFVVCVVCCFHVFFSLIYYYVYFIPSDS